MRSEPIALDRRAALLAGALVVVVAGCTVPNVGSGFSCAEQGICPTDEICDPSDKICKTADRVDPIDAASVDGSQPDAAPIVALDCPVDDNLLLCLDFENDLIDNSPYKHGVVNPATFDIGFVGERAVELTDGALRVVAADSLERTFPRTIEFFGKLKDTSIESFALAQDQLLAIRMIQGYPQCQFGNVGISNMGATVATNTWFHVGCSVNDAGMLVLYLNGSLVTASGSAAIDPMLGLADIDIGADVGGATAPWQGLIDGVKLWREVRTEDQLCTSAGSRLCTNVRSD